MTERFWKLDSPRMCRDFLKDLHMGDGNGGSKHVTEVQLGSGRVVKFDDSMSDEDAVMIANQFAEMMKTEAR